jgi:hypothetical protein
MKEAFRISQKVLGSKQSSGASTAFEMEATTIVQWCTIAEIEMLGEIDHTSRQQLTAINDLYLNNPNNEQFEPDSFMVWARSRHLLGRSTEVYNIINQVNNLLYIRVHFVAGLNNVTLMLRTDDRHVSLVPTRPRGQSTVAGHRRRVGASPGHRPAPAGRRARPY